MLSDRAYRLKGGVFSRLGPLKEIFAFNRATRERWVAEEASQVPRGARVLDVGAVHAHFAICLLIATMWHKILRLLNLCNCRVGKDMAGWM